MAPKMPDWSEFPSELLVSIGRCLNLIEDYLNFGSVCKSWHSVATKNNFNNDLTRAPWLMLAEEEDNEVRKFFSLYNGMILNKRMPKASRKRCLESMGWLITVGEEGEIRLLHPFSGVHIELPHVNTTEDYYNHEIEPVTCFIGKAVLSASPSNTSDYILMVIDGNFWDLRFWRPGDIRWTKIKFEGSNYFSFTDIILFNDQIYSVDQSSCLLVCDVAEVVGPQLTKCHTLAQIPTEPQDTPDHLYILESLGSLFVIARYGVQLRLVQDDSDRIPLTLLPEGDTSEDGLWENITYGTTNFRVFQFDSAAVKLIETRELGDAAFFVGANASISVQASQCTGIKPNHIYFTDDFYESYLSYDEGGGLDMGVFNLADGSIQPHYRGVSLSRFCPPIWVTPTPY
ncbi:F-box protein At2g26160 [Solanum lycopersicum]|uniref:F-box protein At2g26160 n=1 Tax=Solanum lycopersicum TaxID=4081 RepID=UPI000276895B|nr:putative F-box protein At3g25750 [Solanum lycopersicum]